MEDPFPKGMPFQRPKGLLRIGMGNTHHLKLELLVLRILLFILLCCFYGSASAQANLHSGSKRAIKAYQSAKGSLRARDFNEAERLLVKALRADKGFDEAVLLLHQLYLKKKQPEKSADIFNTSADLLELPFANRALFDQANYFFEIGEYEKAQPSINRVNGEVYKTPPDVVQLLEKSISFAVSEKAQVPDIWFQLLPKPLNAFTLQYFPSISATPVSSFLPFAKTTGEGKKICILVSIPKGIGLNPSLFLPISIPHGETKARLLSRPMALP